MKLKSLLFAFAITVLVIPSVKAASVGSLQREVRGLKDDLKIIQRKLYDNENSGINDFSENAANLQIKMGEYENLIRESLGRVDEMDYKLKDLEKKLDIMNKDYELRFKQLEGKKITKPLEVPTGKETKEVKKQEKIEKVTAPVKVKPAEVTKVILPAEELYEKAFNILKQGKYLAAETEFETLLKTYPKHKLAGNAQYWLGESYYVRKDYARSIVAFSKGIQEYKDAAKGPDSLLKLGMSFKALKKNTEACGAFKLMATEFPKASQSLKDKAIEQAKILGCK